MTDQQETKEALDHLRQTWVILYLDPFRDSPNNKRKRAAICAKILKWRKK